jgi:cation:H+ antiporter
MFILWLKFVAAAAVVVFSGYKICVYGEKIAQRLKVGHSFIGLMLLAVVTSLPELAVALSAVKIRALDMAMGDLFGSNLFNLTIIGVIFVYFIRNPRSLSFENTHFISSSISTLLIALAALGIIFFKFRNIRAWHSPVLLDAATAVILASYLFGAYLIFRNEKQQGAKVSGPEPGGKKNIPAVWGKFVIFSAVLVASAIYLAHLGDKIALIPVQGAVLGGTFVGSLFLAITTSLPEVAVAVSAVRLGFWNMALGNIFGSNMFNMLIISVADLSLGRQAILSRVSSLHLITIMFVIISTGLVSAGLVYRSKNKVSGLSWDSASIIFVYFAAMLLNFYLR